MLTLDQAVDCAIKRASIKREDIFIFYEGDDYYDIGDQHEADTFFFGQNPVAIVHPDKSVEEFQ